MRDTGITPEQRIFPITYAGPRKMIVKVGDMVGIKLRPHDLQPLYASRAGVPIEIVSKVILRHVDLSTTQRYFDKVSDHEAAVFACFYSTPAGVIRPVFWPVKEENENGTGKLHEGKSRFDPICFGLSTDTEMREGMKKLIFQDVTPSFPG